MKIPLLLSALALQGCAAIIPNTAKLELEHVSHPMAGWPTGPKSQEDSLTQVNGIASWTISGIRVESGLGYSLLDKGFYGPSLTYTGRISKEWRLK